METFGQKFGILVRLLRERMGMTSSELSETAFGNKANRARISELENGKIKKTHPRTIIKIANALSISEEMIESIRSDGDQAPSPLQISLGKFENRIAEKITETETKLITAHEEEKALLTQQIQELTRRAQNPEAALAEAQATIRKLEDTLTCEGSEISEVRKTEARQALKANDFSIADDIFAEIEIREQLAVERAAHAAFVRGEIAEQEIRWVDAAEQYIRSATLYPSFNSLTKAYEFAWRTGEYRMASRLCNRARNIANLEFGLRSAEYSKTLNDEALLHKSLGQYSKAEPLYKQAIKIEKEIFGENHPNYATRLNNLASLYKSMGRYKEAESLFIQAIRIDKETIGEKHPDYAIDLKNLASLYENIGRYSDAESLFKRAIKIDNETIGEKHPEFATSLNNLATLYYSMGQYNKAEPLLKQAIEIDEATLGSDHPQTKKHKSNLAGLQSSR